ncbi:LysE family transporter [Streptomyces sp. TSRI0281]|uniref:LysE family transporter n=1 Tax=Streptomyces sp. TSRI0281 TaxID=1718998 RepID=UPI003083E3ED
MSTGSTGGRAAGAQAAGCRGCGSLLLTTVHILIGLIWSAVLIGFAHVLHGRLRKPQARRLLDRITGTVIAAFGIRLALGD